MKQTKKTFFAVLLTVLLLFSFTACKKEKAAPDTLWQNAVYTQDREFGSGKTTIQTEVKAGNKSVTFTIKTDKATLGDALLEHQLIDGDQGAYGLYVKVVNGITANYDIDQSYWAFYKSGELLMTGVDQTELADGGGKGLQIGLVFQFPSDHSNLS